MADTRTLIDVPARSFRSEPLTPRKVGPDEWEAALSALERGDAVLLGLWADRASVFMALHARGGRHVGILDYHTTGAFPSVGARHPAAQRLERAIRDLYGLTPHGAPDARAWLDHGKWEVARPLGASDPVALTEPYVFLPAEGESLHQVPVGPVHAGIIEPGHFRFTAQGETVVRLEQRLGYTHKGIEWLMRGSDIKRGAELAGRTSGDSTVAYAWAFAQAVEAALGLDPPPRALHLRAIMAELERLANHLGDVGAICNDAAFAMMLAHCGALREQVLRAAKSAFGHRLMRDRIVPGGVTCDVDTRGLAAIRDLTRKVAERLPGLVDLYDSTATLLDRTVGTGRLSTELAARFGAGGYVGRASGRDFDVRRDLKYAPYHDLAFEVPGRTDGDVNARVWVRLEEIEQSLRLVEQLLDTLPEGTVGVRLPEPEADTSGLGLVEGFRGDVLAWVSLDSGGRISAAHLRDPSWFQWPLLEAVIEGNIIADFPLCNKSFNCSYSGHDR